MNWRQAGALFLAVLMAGCGSTHWRVLVTSGEGDTVIHIPRLAEVQPVKVTPEELAQALQELALEVRLIGTPRETVWRMFQLDALSGDYRYLPRDNKLVPIGSGMPLDGALTDEEEKLARDYKGWCSRAYGLQGDCLGGVLVGGRYVDMHGRYVLALALSKSPVLTEMQTALGEMVSAQAIMSAALWTIMAVLVLLALPEPVTKLLAANMAAILILWVGVDTLYNLVTGWLQLMEEVKYATTFEELRAAGEKYGKVIGRDAARAFAMLATAAIGQTAQGFAAKMPTLPGSAQVAAQAEAQAGFSFSAVGMVDEVAMTAEGFTVTLPAGAVAMASKAGRSGGTCIETHHIATICNDVSAARGGPWTPRFRRLFAKAGLKLDDPANKVPIPGHRGPHPQRYHELVFNRVSEALRGCRSVETCQTELRTVLKKLASEIATPGTELHQLVTRTKPQ